MPQPTNNDALDLLDTLIDRIDAMSPEELEDLRAKAAAITFDPNEPVDREKLQARLAAWRDREADKLFHGE